MTISQICYANESYSNVFNPLWSSCAVTQPSAFAQSNCQSPIDYSVQGNRLTQTVDGSIELSPHHPAFVAGQCIKSSFDKICTVSGCFFRNITNFIRRTDTHSEPKTSTEKNIISLKPIKEADSLAKPEFLPNKPEVDPSLLEKFKQEFRWFRTCDKSLQKIGSDLFEIVPKNFELQDLVHLVFEKDNHKEIRLLLDAILMRNPTFILSPYNQIRRVIIEDEGQHLTNDDLTSMLREHNLDADKEKVLGCYSLAFRMNHPYIYQVAQKPILSSDYTLNFLWENLNPQNRVQDLAQNIFGDGINSFENAEDIIDSHKLRTFERTEQALEKEIAEHWQQIKKTITYRISRWADAHPNASINLWYDSALVTQNAQLKTFELMREISHSRGVNLKLRDIRRLSNIQGEIENSLHPGTPLYYRIDLLKALITDHMLSSHEESAKYFIFSDMDIEPVTSQQIFDQRTIDYLSSYGYVFNRVGLGKFENSFFIFDKEKQDIQKNHNRDIIQKMASLIADLRNYPLNTAFRSEYILDSQSIFNQYSQFLKSMHEPSLWSGDDELTLPRKVVRCPRSQFDYGGKFLRSDHQSELFRFIGSENIPYTKFGRNFDKYGYSEAQIDELRSWKAEPLTSS